MVFYECNQPGVVALTFDDGPALQTSAILDALKAQAGQIGLIGPQGSASVELGPVGPQGPVGLSNGLKLNIKTTDTIFSVRSLVDCLESDTLAIGTWVVWTWGKYEKGFTGSRVDIRLQNVVSGADFSSILLQANSNSLHEYQYILHGVTTVSSSGTVRMRAGSGGSYSISIRGCDLKCIRIR